MIDIFWLLLGVALIIFAANWLTDGAASIARRFGISDLVVGLTVVAFGTSTPELSISIVSALQGNAPMAIGNVVGSNIFNILVIIGVVALIRPIKVERSLMVNDIGLVVISALALLAIGYGDILGAGPDRIVSRVNGILLLLFFAIFLRYTFSQAKGGEHNDDPAATKGAERKELPIWRSVLLIIAGLAGLVYGGDRFVAGASGVAMSLGMSEAVVGLTIVAAGTSLPELAASISAAVKGNSGIAIGNVIGSNIFNIFLVLGTTATISPLPFGGISHFDLVVMIAASLAFWLFCWKFGKQTITRAEGAILVAFYIAYVAYQVMNVSV
ncbi:MAG: calcium/sodium antiporter [Muribaculaceae bacterium]|nr:calcium/sodium antiporter [Muribaculaceae bacterium]